MKSEKGSVSDAMGNFSGECLAGGADFSSKNLQHLERECGLRVHECEEFRAADEAHARSRACDGTERVWLVADESRQAEYGSGQRLDREDGPPVVRIHGELALTFMQDVDALRRSVLLEEKTIGIARKRGGMFLKCLKKLGIGDECG